MKYLTFLSFSKSVCLLTYLENMAAKPIPRNSKPGWEVQHQMFIDIAANTKQEVLLIGDSIVSGLSRYRKMWSKYFEPLQALNFGIGRDRTQNVLLRIQC